MQKPSENHSFIDTLAAGLYNTNLGAVAGLKWKRKAWSLSAQSIACNSDISISIGTAQSGETGMVQLGMEAAPATGGPLRRRSIPMVPREVSIPVAPPPGGHHQRLVGLQKPGPAPTDQKAWPLKAPGAVVT
jgi:hypothetical protein